MAKLVATKGNLLALKQSLKFAKNGFELLDRKRNVLIKEMMSLNEQVQKIRYKIVEKYQEAYDHLEDTNISLGVIEDIAESIAIENSVKITYRSIMGVEIPNVIIDDADLRLEYGFEFTNSRFDQTYILFSEVKALTIALVEVDTSLYRLANAIRKTQKRANALKNISIPSMEENIKFINDSLEEKEREEFIRLKMIKKR
ncbi:MAG: V-type ATP synthase subunit D [Erysipelotrichaceae bacterium]